jgi:hypothetical protein
MPAWAEFRFETRLRITRVEAASRIARETVAMIQLRRLWRGAGDSSCSGSWTEWALGDGEALW